MSSLWTIFRKKQNVAYDKLCFDAATVTNISSYLDKYPPVLVNATGLVADLTSQRCPVSSSFDLTPGFRSLWLEYMCPYTTGPAREATTVLRFAPTEQMKGVAHHLYFYLWTECEDMVALVGTAEMALDPLGNPLSDNFITNWEPNSRVCERQFALALEALTTMNTRGTRVEPPIEKHVQVVRPNRAPFSVWHTIHLPKMPSIPLDGAETSATMLERREHWVRAHRRDYRSGGGMFGRIKALVWVPEFQRGNPELGTVKQSYAVAAKK